VLSLAERWIDDAFDIEAMFVTRERAEAARHWLSGPTQLDVDTFCKHRRNAMPATVRTVRKYAARALAEAAASRVEMFKRVISADPSQSDNDTAATAYEGTARACRPAATDADETCWMCEGRQRFEGDICDGCGSIADGRGGTLQPVAGPFDPGDGDSPIDTVLQVLIAACRVRGWPLPDRDDVRDNLRPTWGDRSGVLVMGGAYNASAERILSLQGWEVEWKSTPHADSTVVLGEDEW
jgi:hypothetical protein